MQCSACVLCFVTHQHATIHMQCSECELCFATYQHAACHMRCSDCVLCFARHQHAYSAFLMQCSHFVWSLSFMCTALIAYCDLTHQHTAFLMQCVDCALPHTSMLFCYMHCSSCYVALLPCPSMPAFTCKAVAVCYTLPGTNMLPFTCTAVPVCHALPHTSLLPFTCKAVPLLLCFCQAPACQLSHAMLCLLCFAFVVPQHDGCTMQYSGCVLCFCHAPAC